MIARITKYQIDPDSIEESIRNFNEKIIPAVKLQKGYRKGYLLIARKTGQSITIAFWDSEKEALADEQGGNYQTRVDTGKGRYKTPPIRELYEVVAQD